MEVMVRLHDALIGKVRNLYSYGREPFKVVIVDHATVRELIDLMELDRDWVGMVAVNGDCVSVSTQLAEKDLVEFFAPVVGG